MSNLLQVKIPVSMVKFQYDIYREESCYLLNIEVTSTVITYCSKNKHQVTYE